MTLVQKRYTHKQGEVDYVQAISDVFVIVLLVVVCNIKDSVKNAEPFILVLFFIPTFINAYLKRRKVRGLTFWAVVFYGYCLTSLLWTIAPYTYYTAYLKTVLVILTITLYISDMREVDMILKGFLLSTAILLFRLLMSMPLDQLGSSRLGSSIGINENIVGMYFLFASTICIYYTKKAKIYYFPYIIFLLMTLLSGSRRALALTLLVVIVFYINSIKKVSNVIYIIPFGVLFFLVIDLTMNNPILYQVIGRRVTGLINMLTGEGKVDNSTLVRMDLIQIGVELFKEKMWIGHGANSYRFLNKYSLYSHNNYIELLVNHGIIGLVLYYIMPLMILMQLARIWLYKTREVIIAILFIVVIIVGDYGNVSFYSSTEIIFICISYCMAVFHSETPQYADLKKASKSKPSDINFA